MEEKRRHMSTPEFDSGFGVKGTLNAMQFRALGYKKSFFSGWRKDMRLKRFTEEEISKYVSLCDAHLKNRKPKKPRKNKRETESGKKIMFDRNGSTRWQYGKPQWMSLRDRILSRDDWRCVSCGGRSTTNGMMKVHHLLYERGEYVWDVPDWYLVTLCDKCHKAEHSRNLIPPPKHF